MAVPPENQDPLETARQNVAKQQFLMQRKLDDENLKDALKYATHMIYELKTAKLGPQKYYELYMQVMNALHDLTVFIEDEAQKNKTPEQTAQYLEYYYEYVQYSGNIIPRLYLLNCVGGVCLKLESDPDKRMKRLRDMIDMNKGVQHPTRGLFLRNYLSQVARDHIPDVESPQEEPSPAVLAGIQFILENFGEMTRLWVRMQHQGAVRDRAKREKERMQLRMLVGATLRRLVELTAVTKERYQEEVFPAVQEKIIKCKDRIAQEYLMDCIIHIVSDEYHLSTLEEFLGTCTKLVSQVDVKDIITSLMDRLAKFASENPALFSENDVFPVFQEQCEKLVTKRKKMAVTDKLELQVSLVNFATNCYPDQHDYVIGVWKTCLKLIRKVESKGKGADLEDRVARDHLVDLLTKPVSSMQMSILDFEDYPLLLGKLGFEKQREAATRIARALVQKETIIGNQTQVEKLFTALLTILQDQPETPELTEDNRFIFNEEQFLVSNLIGRIRSEDCDDHFDCLLMARTFFAKGGEERQKSTFPCLLYNALQLIRNKNQLETEEESRYSLKKIFRFINAILTAYGQIDCARCIRMYLDAAMAADKCGYETAVYGFIEAAFELYETGVGDSKEQRRIMQSMTGCLLSITSIDEDNFDTLRQNTVQHCNRLLKKPYQALAVAGATNLFWNCKNEEWKSEQYVVKCLNKSAKIAKNIMKEVEKANVYITILNHFIHFYRNGVSQIDVEQINQLIQIVAAVVEEIEEDEEGLAEVQHYFRNTRCYIEEKKGSDEAEAELFAGIEF